MDITQEELDKLIEDIRDRFSYLNTQVGASSMINGETARDLCKAYRIVLKDLEGIIL